MVAQKILLASLPDDFGGNLCHVDIPRVEILLTGIPMKLMQPPLYHLRERRVVGTNWQVLPIFVLHFSYRIGHQLFEDIVVYVAEFAHVQAAFTHLVLAKFGQQRSLSRSTAGQVHADVTLP